MLRTVRKRVATVLAALAFAGAGALAVAGDGFEKALPASTFAVFRTDSVKNLKSAFSSSQMGQLWADPSMRPLKDKIASSLEEADAKVKEAIGISLEDLLDLPQGEATLALVARDDATIPLMALVTVDAGDNATKMADVMARLDKLAEGEGAKVATEQAGDTPLHVIRASEEAEAPPLVWAQSGSVFYVSSDIDGLKDLLGNLKGREDSLASNEAYQAVARKVDVNSHMFWYADVNQLVNMAVQIASANGVNGEEIATQIQLTGLNGLKALGGSFEFGEGEFDSVSKAYFYAPAPLQGVLKLFSSPAADLRPQPWVPTTISSYAAFSWEMDKFWGSLTELVDQFAPGQLEVLEQAVAGPDGSGLNIKKDIFAALGKRITVISDYKQPITDESQRAVVAFELRDSNVAQNTIAKIFNMVGAEPKARDFQGIKIYDIDLPEEVEAAGSGLSGPISIAIAKDHLFVSTEPTLLEQVLRAGGESLSANSEFQEALKHIPSGVSMLSFDQPEDQIQVMYSMLNNEQFKTALSQVQEQAPDGPKLEEFLDPKLLPDFKAIEKYFSPSASYAVTSEDGLMVIGFTLKAKK